MAMAMAMATSSGGKTYTGVYLYVCDGSIGGTLHLAFNLSTFSIQTDGSIRHSQLMTLKVASTTKQYNLKQAPPMNKQKIGENASILSIPGSPNRLRHSPSCRHLSPCVPRMSPWETYPAPEARSLPIEVED